MIAKERRALNELLNALNEELFVAVAKGNCDTVESLIRVGADVHALDSNDNGLLHLAIRSAGLDVITVLLENGANVFSHDDDRELTPLHYAAYRGDIAILKRLLNDSRSLGHTKKIRARKLNSILDDNSNTILHIAASAGTLEIIEWCMGVGMDIDLPNSDGLTPLHLAVSNGQVEATKSLIRGKASLNDRTIALLDG